MTYDTFTQTPGTPIASIGHYPATQDERPHPPGMRRSEPIPFTGLRRRMLTLVHPSSPPERQVPSLLAERIQAFMNGNLKNRTTLKELARFLGYSEKYSSEFFQLQMGTSFSHYLKHLRIMKAKHMLTGDDASVTHVAEALGFSDSFSFSHFFKRAVGCSPTAFRKQQSAHGV
jgi:AraC-like DNA-binding protein